MQKYTAGGFICGYVSKKYSENKCAFILAKVQKMISCITLLVKSWNALQK